MSRRSANNIRGPTSALTEFLRGEGINANNISRRARTRNQPNAESEAEETQEQEAPQEAGPSTRRTTRRSAAATPTITAEDGNASDALDESETEEPPAKKRKLTKAQEAKIKSTAKAKAKAEASKKKKKKNSDDEDYEEDPYSALSFHSSAKPAPGSFATCVKCEKQFTVTKYTQECTSPRGWLCQPCTKAAGIDPFKKPAAPRKRKTPGEKRKVPSFEENLFPSLVSLCVKLISKYIDDVEALGDISALSLDSISKAISKSRSLTAHNVQLFYGAERDTLTLYDATNLDADNFSTLALLNPNVENLRLDYCGRIDNSSLSTWSNGLASLTSLELLGPFLVHSSAWCDFFVSHPQLRSFKITQSPRFNLECMQALFDECSYIQELRLSEIGEMNDEFLGVIEQWGTQMLYLDLSDPSNSCSDDAVGSLLKACGLNLDHLDLSGHLLLTDKILLDGIQSHCTKLSSLYLRNLPEITNEGVTKLFGAESVPAPTKGKGRKKKAPATETQSLSHPLHNLDLSRNPQLSTTSLTAILSHSASKLQSLSINGWNDTEETALAEIGKTGKGLTRVDVGWCRQVNDFVINEMMKGCEQLSEVKVWGCSRITVDCPRKRGVSIRGVESHTSL